MGVLLTDLIVPEEMHARHDGGIRRFHESGEGPVLGRRIEVPAKRRDGRLLSVELMVTPIEHAGSHLFLGFIRDITRRKAEQRTLERQARVSTTMFELAAMAGATDSFEEAVATALRALCELGGWPVGHALVVQEGGEALVSSGIWHSSAPAEFLDFAEASRNMCFRRGEGLPGRIFQEGRPVWVGRSKGVTPFTLRAAAADAAGINGGFGFPVKTGSAVIVVLEFLSRQDEPPDAELFRAVGIVGEQIGRVFERKLLEDKLRAEKAALEAEVAERIRMERRQALLLAELNHRVKNTLTVVMGIASQTARSAETMRGFTDDFLGRLSSLARTHSLLTDREWGAATIADLAREVIAPHIGSPDPRVVLDGPEVWLEQKAVLSLSMILHELTTNAVKHGALSETDGTLSVTWSRAADEIELRWRERGVTIDGAPKRTGFGSKMIRACVGHELRGSAEAGWHPDGLEYVVRFPVSGGGATE